MTRSKLIKHGPYFVKLALLILSTHFLEKILEPLASKLGVKIHSQMPHAPSTMQVWPRNMNVAIFLQFLDSWQYTFVAIMEDTHVRPLTNHGPLDEWKKPQPAFSILRFHKSKGNQDNLVVCVDPNAGEQLPFINSGQTSSIHTENWSAMFESFNHAPKGPEGTPKHPVTICILIVININYSSWIPTL